jgi:CTP:molybdopterin cytidylyltransferase MocA
MGRSKQLLAVRDRPAVLRCIDAVRGAGVSDVVAVVNSSNGPLVDIVRSAGVTVAFNDDPASEMAASARIGLRHIAPSARAVFIVLSDHPLVTSATISSLIDAHRENPDRIVIPFHRGKRGHPTLFPREMLTELDRGLNLRDIIHLHASLAMNVPVDDEGAVIDMDTVEDYQRVVRKAKDAGIETE